MESILDYYRQFYERNIPTDVISVDDDFSQYDLVVAPVLYMVKAGLSEKKLMLMSKMVATLSLPICLEWLTIVIMFILVAILAR